MSIESVMPSNRLILSCPLLLPPSIFPSIRVFSKESVLIRGPKYSSFSFSISPSNKYSGMISFMMDWLDLLAVLRRLSRVFSNTTVQKHQFFGAQLSLWSTSHTHTWLMEHLLELSIRTSIRDNVMLPHWQQGQNDLSQEYNGVCISFQGTLWFRTRRVPVTDDCVPNLGNDTLCTAED